MSQLRERNHIHLRNRATFLDDDGREQKDRNKSEAEIRNLVMSRAADNQQQDECQRRSQPQAAW
jgi:hypothetical protein